VNAAIRRGRFSALPPRSPIIRKKTHGTIVPIFIERRARPAALPIDQARGGETLTIVEVIASREGVTVALRPFVVGRRFI
jgi:hypothetical protein